MNPLRHIVTMIRGWHDRRLRAQADAVLPEILVLLERAHRVGSEREGFCFELDDAYALSPNLRKVFSSSEYEVWFDSYKMAFMKRWSRMNPHLVAPIKAYLALRS